MSHPIIRPARADEYDEIGRVWMESWVSTGLGETSNFLLANLRARIRREIEGGWSLFAADDNGTIAAMLALHLPKLYLDMLFVAPAYQGQSLGRQFARLHAHANAGRDVSALRPRKRKSLALVRTRRLCVREARDRAVERVHDEVLSVAAAAARWIDSELWVQLAGSATQVFDVLEAALANGPWILDEFSAADITIGSGLNFAVRLFKTVPSRPAFDACLARRMARPAFQRAETIAAG
ncbi:GNAT superfamily N-acetyltransferase [Bradyrhizobium sp. LB1.3]